MPFPEDIRRGIQSLKQMCHPRGHDLLDAIQEVLVGRAEADDQLDAQLYLLFGQEVVDGTAALPLITDEVVGHEVLADNDRWSRKTAELKAVQ